jgi:uncharacterized protein (TIGR02217 family)
MSNIIYPTLPGITLETKRTPMHKTLLRESASGIESRATYQAYPQYLITLKYEVLRAGAEQEKQKLEGFFNARRGAYDDFLFLDTKDNTCADQQFAIADGSTTTFRLSRSLIEGGLKEPVSAIFNTPVIKHNGVLQAAATYTIDQYAAKITYNTAPAAGVALTWGGQYYWRVRFLRDDLDFQQFLWDLWKLDKVELQTVKTR